MQKIIDFTLPEFVFLDGGGPNGDTLEGRTVLQHIRSYTIVEVLALAELPITSMRVPLHKFEYVNRFGVVEQHAFAVHFSLAEETQLPEIVEKCRAWYVDYLAWEDNNIIEDDDKERDN